MRMNRVTVARAAAGLARLPAGARPTSPSVVVGYDARTTPTSSRATPPRSWQAAGVRALLLPDAPAHARARLRDPAPRRRGRRHGHRLAQPAARQRLQGLPRRHEPDRAAGRRRDRRRDRRGRTGRRAAPRRRATTVLGHEVAEAYVDAVVALSADGPRDSSWPTPRCTASGATPLVEAVARAGFPRAARRGASRREPDPDFPTVAFPNPEEPGAMDLALELAAAGRRRRHHRQRPRRRPLRRGRARPARPPDAHRRPGRRAARRRPAAPRRRGHLRLLDRLVRPARPPGRRARTAVAADPHRLQVDRQGRGTRLRLRGGARLLRRAAHRPRQGRHLGDRCSILSLAASLKARGPHAARPARRRLPPSTAGTPPASCPCGSTTSSIIAAAMDRLRTDPPTDAGGRRGHVRRRPRRRATAACRPPTGSGSDSTAAVASSAARRAPSRSSSATSRSSSPSRARWRTRATPPSPRSRRSSPTSRRTCGWAEPQAAAGASESAAEEPRECDFAALTTRESPAAASVDGPRRARRAKRRRLPLHPQRHRRACQFERAAIGPHERRGGQVLR